MYFFLWPLRRAEAREVRLLKAHPPSQPSLVTKVWCPVSGAGLWDPWLAPSVQFLRNISIPNPMPQGTTRPCLLLPCPHRPFTPFPTSPHIHTPAPDLRHVSPGEPLGPILKSTGLCCSGDCGGGGLRQVSKEGFCSPRPLCILSPSPGLQATRTRGLEVAVQLGGCYSHSGPQSPSPPGENPSVLLIQPTFKKMHEIPFEQA